MDSDTTPSPLPESTRTMIERARTIAERSLAPRAALFETDGQIPSDVFVELARAGLFGVNVPAALGGAGAGVVAYALSLAEIASACASTAVSMAVTNMVAEVLVRFGSNEQRERYLPLLMGGGLGAFALSEAEAGSDPAAMNTRATRDGESWILEGAKQWISSGDSAEVIVVWARTGAAGAKGITAFLVPKDAPGLEVLRLEKKMGLRASHTAALGFERIRLPAEAVLGVEGGGFAIAMAALDGGRIGIGAQALGIAEAAYRHLERPSVSPAHRLARLRPMLDEARTALDAARLLVLRAALRKERALPFSREASMAKLFATEAACRVVDLAYREQTGDALASDLDRWLRDVRVTTIYEGTSEIQRLVIAREILRQTAVSG